MEARETRVKQIIAQIIKVKLDELGNNDDLVDKFGMDSMSRIEIVTELEKEFNLTIDDAEAIKLRSVASCLELISRDMPNK